MAYDRDRDSKDGRPQRGGNRKRRKVCAFCAEKSQNIDYKDTAKLRRFLSERSKILPRRATGTCAMHQRELTDAIKRARQIALLPYVTD
jgi:small subunit ribosomal protein S18